MSEFTFTPRPGLERALRLTVRAGILLFRISRCIVTATGLGVGFAVIAFGGLLCIMVAAQPDYSNFPWLVPSMGRYGHAVDPRVPVMMTRAFFIVAGLVGFIATRQLSNVIEKRWNAFWGDRP